MFHRKLLIIGEAALLLSRAASSAHRRFCGARLLSIDPRREKPRTTSTVVRATSYYRHRAVFYRGVETPASFSFRFLYRHA
jgi:hypothetical protein